MRSRQNLWSPLLVALIVLTGVGGASAATTLGAKTATVQAAQNGGLGTKIVVNASGFTLYHLTSEKKGAIGCSAQCRKVWPPLLVVGSAKPVAGTGLSASKLGTIKRPDGGVQLTYNGLALYRYSGDTKAGQTKGQGISKLWYAITPAGVVTKATVKTSGSGSSSSVGASGSSSSGSGTVVTSSGSGGGSGSGSGSGSLGSAGSTAACASGQSIPQGTYSGDGDDDNNGGPDDGDGCL